MNKLISTLKRFISISLISITLLLGGCVENADGLQLADGIGGTGITTGRLTSFGSVYVNGIHFNTDSAVFVRDDVSSSTQSEFNIGEIIRVEGSVNADRKTGTANKVIYSDVLQGPVTTTADGRTLLVMQQMVVTDPLTVLHNVKKLSDLKVDNIVEVSGYTDADGKIRATSIRLLSDAFTTGDTLEIEGNVSQLNIIAQTFQLNGLTVQYAQSTFNDLTHTELRNGLYLAVTARQEMNDGIMIAAELTKLDEALEGGVDYEVEGLVSYFMAPGYFEVDGFPVSTNTDTTFTNGSVDDIDENSLLIVTGTSNSQGIIVAGSVQLIDYAAETYLEANISAVDADTNTITVLGQAITINQQTLLSDDTTDDFIELNLNEFAVGEAVYVVAYQHGDTEGNHYTASRLSRIAAIQTLYLSGKTHSPDSTQGQLQLFGNTAISDSDTLYLDENANEMSRQAFFSQLTNDTQVGVIGRLLANGYILAENLTLEIE